MSSGKRTFDDYFVGDGVRSTVNLTEYVAAAVELTRQPTGNPYYGSEWHTAVAVKGAYRAEQHRWLKFAGLNFFGVAGPAFVNRSVAIAAGPFVTARLQRHDDYAGLWRRV